MRKWGKHKLLLLALTIACSSAIADEAALLQRIEKLERITSGQGLVTLSGKVDQLQAQIQDLNGQNEALMHKLESLERRQRELYLDLDKRIQTQAMTSIPVQVPASTSVAPQAVPPSSSSVSTPVVPATVAVTQGASSSATPPLASEPVDQGEEAYKSALQLLRSGQYESAVTALSAFPEQYPQSSYLPNVYYWQGEAQYVLRNFEAAITAFQTVVDGFPDSSKVPDALLKQGFSQHELAQIDTAKATLTTVIQQYPNTSAARLAKVRLDKIQQETR